MKPLNRKEAVEDRGEVLLNKGRINKSLGLSNLSEANL